MRRAIIIVLVGLIFVNVVFLLKMTGEEDFDTVTPLGDNEHYRVLDTELIPRGKVTTFCVNESVIVLFYDEQGVVNVYTYDGTFLYGLQVSTIRNGVGDIALEGEYIYIKARGNRMYIFKGKELILSFRRSENPEKFGKIQQIIESEKNHTINGETYHYLPETNKIVKHTPQGTMVSVISMPQMNADIRMQSIILLLLIAALVHYLRFHRDNLKAKTVDGSTS